MKRITMLQTLASDREVFQKDKTYEIHDPKQLESFLKSGIAKLDQDPEPAHQYDDQLSDDEINERKKKVDKRLAKLREDEKTEKK